MVIRVDTSSASITKRKRKAKPKALTKTQSTAVRRIVKGSKPLKYYDTIVSSNQVIYNIVDITASGSYNFCDIPVFAATSGSATAGGRTSLRIHIHEVDFRTMIVVPSGMGKFNMRVILVYFPSSGGTDMQPSKILQNNVSTSPTNAAMTSPFEPNCPYRILSDRTYTYTNPFSVATRHEFKWVKKFKRPLKVEYGDANTSGPSNTQKGLLRVFWLGDDASLGTVMNGYQNRIKFRDA